MPQVPPKIGVSISVVVPVYNSAETVPALIARLDPVLRALATDFEVILVDDGSGEETRKAIAVLVSTHPWVRVISLMRNYGQHNALLCGIRAARGEIIVTIDDDLQNPPEEIPRLLERLAQGFDVVYGTPAHQQHDPWRVIASQVTRLCAPGSAWRRYGTARQCVPCISHVPERRVRGLSKLVRVDRRTAHMGHRKILSRSRAS